MFVLIQGILLIGLLTDSSAAVDKAWDGECGTTNWQCANNWKPNGIPGMSDNVNVDDDDGPIAIPTGTAEVNQANIFSSLTISTSNPVTFHGMSQIANLTAGQSSNAKLFADATVIFSGSSFSSGTLDGSGTFANVETMSVGEQLRTTLENHGNMTILLEDLTVDAGGLLKNFGTLEIPGLADINKGSTGTNGLENSGTIRKTTSGLALLSPDFTQTGGMIDVQAGTLRVNGAFSLQGGSASVAEGALLEFVGNPGPTREFMGISQFTGSGRVEIEAPVTVGCPITTTMADGFVVSRDLTLNLATINNSGDFFFSGGGVIGGGTLFNEPGGLIETSLGGVVTIGANVSNSGTFEQFHDIEVDFFTLTNEQGGQWNINEGGFTAASGNIVNKGTMTVRDFGGGFCNVNVPFDISDGAEMILEGDTTMQIRGGGQWGGAKQAGVRILSADSRLIIRDTPLTNTETVRIQGFFEPGNPAVLFEVNGIGDTPILVVRNFFVSVVSELNGGVIRGPGILTNSGGEMHLKGAVIGQDALLNNENRNIHFDAATLIQGQLLNQSTGTIHHHNPETLTLALGALAQNSGVYEALGGSILGGGRFVNENMFRSGTSPGQFLVDCIFSNLNMVHARGTDIVFMNAGSKVEQIIGETLTGGTWIADAGGSIIFQGVPITGIAEGTNVTGDESGLPFLKDLHINLGNLNVTGPVSLNHDAGINNFGGTILNQGSIDTGAGVITNQFTSDDSAVDDLQSIVVLADAEGPAITGGYFTPLLENHGQVTPGGHDQTGPFYLTGDYNHQPTARLNIDLAGLAPIEQHDQLLIDGGATINGGRIIVTLLDGFEPQQGDAFEIIHLVEGTISGEFDAVIGPGSYDVAYNEDSVFLIVTNGPGDHDADGDVDLLDFGQFQLCFSGSGGAVGLGCDPFDFDDDGDVDLIDFGQFQLAFTGGK
jgi:hypothetical protein